MALALAEVQPPPRGAFTELNEKYNTAPCHIQSPKASRLDVSSIIIQAEDLDDPQRRLAERRDERLRELRQVWQKTVSNFADWRPISFDGPEDKVVSAFGRMVSDLCFETLISFVDAQTPDDGKS